MSSKAQNELAQEAMVSVIVPVYNVAPYLPECIESILGQTYHNLELILINDGSTDESGAVCDAYAERDSRVRVVHKANEGVSATRNMGLDLARGEYISFVDPDDIIELDTYEVCLETYRQYPEAHVLHFDFRPFSPDGTADDWIVVKSPKEDLLLRGVETLRFATLSPMYYGSACVYLYRREYIGDIRFKLGARMGEDLLFNLTCMLRPNKLWREGPTMIRVSRAFYNYRLFREGSATTSPDIKWFYDMFDNFVELTRSLAAEGSPNTAYACAYLLKEIIAKVSVYTLPENEGWPQAVCSATGKQGRIALLAPWVKAVSAYPLPRHIAYLDYYLYRLSPTLLLRKLHITEAIARRLGISLK